MSNQLLGQLNQTMVKVLNVLTAIGTSTAPVPVNAAIKNGNYSFSSLGSPSINTLAANQVVYSTPIAPNGEKLTFSLQLFTTGGITLGNDAFIFLECDLAGGTAYKQVYGTKRLFNDAIFGGVNPKNMIVTYDNIKAGNFRVGVNFGTPVGTATGSTGYNVTVSN